MGHDFRHSKADPTAEITNGTARTPLEQIGSGTCSSVWATSANVDSASNGITLKLAVGTPGRHIHFEKTPLENEADIHRQITSAIPIHKEAPESSGFLVNIPRNICFVKANASAWSSILPRLPAKYAHESCQGLFSERIMPLDRPARGILIKSFHGRDQSGPEAIDHSANLRDNVHCLVRPYLGRRQAGSKNNSSNVHRSLGDSDYSLSIDQMSRLGLPMKEYASAIGDALAFLLWEVKVDAANVEFALGRARVPGGEKDMQIGSRPFTKSVLGDHALWLLDFDACQPITMDMVGVRAAAKQFWLNKPYYPTPDYRNDEDKDIWVAFRQRFLATSREILLNEDIETRKLPMHVMVKILETVNTVGTQVSNGY